MKKITFTLTMLMLALFLHAQNYDEIKQNVMLNQYKKAKEDLDKKMTNAKFSSKPEAYILKSTIYAAMAADSAVKDTPEGASLRAESEAAFKKYREMEPTMELAKEAPYKNALINIYTNLFNLGYKQYEK